MIEPLAGAVPRTGTRRVDATPTRLRGTCGCCARSPKHREGKAAKENLCHAREHVRRMQETLNRAGTGALRVSLTVDNESFVSIGDGHLETKVELPTTAELLAAVQQREDLDYSVKRLTENLKNLGFGSP